MENNGEKELAKVDISQTPVNVDKETGDVVMEHNPEDINSDSHKESHKKTDSYGKTSFILSIINLVVFLPIAAASTAKIPILSNAVLVLDRHTSQQVSMFGQLFVLVALIFSVIGIALAGKQKEVKSTMQAAVGLTINFVGLIMTFALIVIMIIS